jgi:hypothetical protein
LLSTTSLKEVFMFELIDFSFLVHESADLYHAKAKHYLSSHQLADFRKCPQLYYGKKTQPLTQEESPAYLLGRAAHVLILEGFERFREDFAVGGPINPRTGRPFGPATNAWMEWAETLSKPVLSDSQFAMLVRMKESVAKQKAAVELLQYGIPEGVVRADYCGLPCQIRIDWLETSRGIVDLKTCDDLTWFEADSRRYGYAHQMAFYRAVLSKALGIYVPVHLIAVEKKEPYRCGVWQLSSEVLNLAQKENEQAIDRLHACITNDSWPTGYEEPRVFDFF